MLQYSPIMVYRSIVWSKLLDALALASPDLVHAAPVSTLPLAPRALRTRLTRLSAAPAIPLAFPAVVLGALAIALGTAQPASAAETVVGFDNLSAGEVVRNQYEAQGLKLGSAGEFGQASPGTGKEGNCGAPTVEAETKSGVAAASAPNYAELPSCTGAGPLFQGTYGALLGQPRGSLSVEVSNVVVGTPTVKMELIGYDGSGQEVASGRGEASPGAWHTITAALSGEAHISFFLIRTETTVASGAKVAIDNLSFEAEPPPKPPPPPPSPPPPSPPTAVLAPANANPHAGEPLTLSGAGSQAGSGHIWPDPLSSVRLL